MILLYKIVAGKAMEIFMKKIIAIIFSVVLVFSAVMLISGCNKDDENTPVVNESTDAIGETEQTTEEPSIEETESETENQESEKPTESTSKTDEEKTETSTKPTETTTEDKKSDICENCGGTIIDDSTATGTLIGNYCDGNCDGWFDV